LATLFAAPCTSAAIIYESGTLGPTGVDVSQVVSGTIPGTNINRFIAVGVRFELVKPVEVSQIGGHFVGGTQGGNLFGALVRLTGPSDLPDSSDLSTADVLGTATIAFPSLSADAFGVLSTHLDPSWYALVFGSGLFGTDGVGVALRNNVDIGSPDYIGRQLGSAAGWGVVSPTFANHRFSVIGEVVPEPPTSMVTVGMLFVLASVAGFSRTFSRPRSITGKF
jgi:hypothetical protein